MLDATPSLRGLYAITDGRQGAALERAVEAALRGGTRLVQYRDKSSDAARRIQEAMALSSLCHQYHAQLIINDDVALAMRCDAAGVHLGRDDMSPERARARLGPAVIIGLSCYNRLPDPRSCAAADYLAFGALFPSTTKPGAVRASLDLLGEAHAALPGLAVCAIGGITCANAAIVATAGADLIAVVAGLFDAADTATITERARTMAALFQ